MEAEVLPTSFVFFKLSCCYLSTEFKADQVLYLVLHMRPGTCVKHYPSVKGGSYEFLAKVFYYGFGGSSLW